jgi:hypothetical protein
LAGVPVCSRVHRMGGGHGSPSPFRRRSQEALMADVQTPRTRYRLVTSDSSRWDGFAFRPGDVVISTPPKCGTTWTQMLCADIRTQITEQRCCPARRRCAGAVPCGRFSSARIAAMARSCSAHGGHVRMSGWRARQRRAGARGYCLMSVNVRLRGHCVGNARSATPDRGAD